MVTEHAPLAYSLDDAARLVGVSRRHVYRLLAEGRLRSVLLGRRRLIAAAELARLLEVDAAEPSPEARRG